MTGLCKDWLKVVVHKELDTIKNILRREPDRRLTAVGMCAGFVVGVFETLRSFDLACPPHGITNDQLVRMVLREVENCPERPKEDFMMPTAAIMIATWSCRK